MIEFQNVSKRFGTQSVLDGASFQINPGERVGIVGPNGAGKTTIMELISGEVSVDAGSLSVPRDMRLGYLHQQLDSSTIATGVLDYVENAVPQVRVIEKRMHALEEAVGRQEARERELTLTQLGELQTQFEHLGGYTLRHEAEATLSALGFAEDRFKDPLATFSGGWQMRAELSRCLVGKPDVLLLDEPSNYLDIPAVEWLQRYLKEFRGTLVLISHDRYLLNSLTTTTLELSLGRLERYSGNYASYVEQRVKRYEQRLAAHANTTKKREKAERFIERFGAKATKASLVKSKVKMLERMDAPAAPVEIRHQARIRLAEPSRSGAEVIRLEDAAASYDGERFVLRHVDFRIERGDRVALVGLNGMGKTTLLRLLTGRLALAEGKRLVGHKVVPGYQSQEFADTMDPHQTVYECVKHVASGVSEQHVRSLLGGFGFSGDAVEKSVSVLSGGEKVRLAFARLLVVPPNFLVLDEPTTHLDIAAREALENALVSYSGTICMVSHDIAFVRRVATSIVAMRPPGIKRYAGGYDYYAEKLAQEARGAESDPGARSNATEEGKELGRSAKERRQERARQRAARSAETRELRKTVKRAERQVAVFETEQKKLVATLEAGDDATDHEEVNRRLVVIQNELARYSRLWEDAAMALEQLDESVE